MENVRKSDTQPEIIAAGHICLDITPVFTNPQAETIGEVLMPGQLLQVGRADVHIGGSAANTGLALKLLGANVTLMGKIGEDNFGELVLSQLKEYDAVDGMIVSPDADTSYSIVVAPRGIDRIFLHHPGANDTFCADDLDYEQIKKASLFHFGYPPLMKRMYGKDGEELAAMFQKIKMCGVLTSLDMAAVDEHSPAGQADWEKILAGTLPYVDFFVPSIEELAFMIDREKLREWHRRAAGRDVTLILDSERDIRPLAEKALLLGAKAVLLKCGVPGMYLATAEDFRLKQNDVSWSGIRRFERSYRPDAVLSGTGAGDTSIAAFLYAAMTGNSPEECLQLAAATGASCVAAYDALSGLKSFEELREKINRGWEKNI